VGRVRDMQRRQQAAAGAAEAAGAVLELPPSTTPTAPAADAIRVKGERNVLVRFSRCCHPVPGDPIMGYVTRGRGVSIHHPDCPNLQSHRGDAGRVIDVSWDSVRAAAYPVEIEITGYDRPGLLSDITQIVAEGRHNILYASARGGTRAGQALIDVVMEVKDLEEFLAVRRKILRVRDVLSAERTVRSRSRGLRALGGPR